MFNIGINPCQNSQMSAILVTVGNCRVIRCRKGLLVINATMVAK